MELVLPAKGDSPEELVSLAELGLLGKEAPEVELPYISRWKLKAAMDRLPDEERDCVDLVAKGCLQTDIGSILGLTQAAISYRLHRAEARLRWMLLEEGSLFGVDELRAALEGEGNFTVREMIFLTALWWTTSQTKANEHLEACGYESWNQSYATQLCRPWVTRRKPGLITRLNAAKGMALYGRGFSSLAGFPPFTKRHWNVLHYMDGCGMKRGVYKRVKEELAKTA